MDIIKRSPIQKTRPFGGVDSQVTAIDPSLLDKYTKEIMLTKTIQFKDWDGNPGEEVHYFNLTQAELTDQMLRSNGTFRESLQAIIDSNDGAQIMQKFDEILAWSYGIRPEGTKRFVKSPEIYQAFKETPAYDVLFMSLVTDADAASAFVNALVPQELQDSAALAAKGREAVANQQAQQAPQAPPVQVGPDATQAAPPVQAQQVFLENLPENGGSTTIVPPQSYNEPHHPGPTYPQ